jgi:hypothetical protein
MKTLTLQNGIALNVYPVPPFAMTAIEYAHPLPEDDGSPEGHVAFQKALQARDKLGIETAWLMALPDVRVPEGWTFPAALRYAGVQPREGAEGLKLDYIEYELLRSSKDLQVVQAAMYESITESEVQAAESTFRPDAGDGVTTAHSAG